LQRTSCISNINCVLVKEYFITNECSSKLWNQCQSLVFTGTHPKSIQDQFNWFWQVPKFSTAWHWIQTKVPQNAPWPTNPTKIFLYKFNPANEMHALEVVKRDSVIKIEPWCGENIEVFFRARLVSHGCLGKPWDFWCWY